MAIDKLTKTWSLNEILTADGVNAITNKVNNVIDNIPTTLPANGGNADTVDGIHIVISSSAGTEPNTLYVVI